MAPGALAGRRSAGAPGCGGGVSSGAGVIGLVLAAAAVYAALTLAVEDQQRRALLPTWRRGKGAEAVSGDWGPSRPR